MNEQQRTNLLSAAEEQLDEELLTDILVRQGCRIERIVSFGQATPADCPYVQDWDEWVLLLKGAARVRLDEEEVELGPGDHLLIPAGVPHWVTFTTLNEPTIWLAIHFH